MVQCDVWKFLFTFTISNGDIWKWKTIYQIDTRDENAVAEASRPIFMNPQPQQT